MGDVFYARPVAVTDDRLRDAHEKQERQRLLREELDSQREAQREARLRAGLPTSNEPMTRAQRHRQRIAAEQEELRRNESAGQVGAPAGPFSPPSHNTEALAGTFGRGANPYQPVRSSTSSLPAIGKAAPAPSALPPLGTDHSPRYAPPQVPQMPVAPSVADDESVYQWNRQPPPSMQPPTPPQGPVGSTYQRQPQSRPNPYGSAVPPEQLGGTLSRAPPPGATQEELAQWLNQATEEIRRVRGELGEQPVADDVAQKQRGRGPATRGAKVDRARDDAPHGKQPLVRGASNQRTSSNQRQRGAPAPAEGKKVAKLEATLAGQMEEMRRMKKQQEEWQSQVDKLNRDLKNAREKEKHLTKAVINKKTGVREKRAETAPKPALPPAARGGRLAEKDRRPITAGVDLDPIATDGRSSSKASLPPLPEDLRASYESRRGLPTPRGNAPTESPSRQKPPRAVSEPPVHQRVAQEEPYQTGAPSDAAPSTASVSFAQLLKFTDSRMLTHKQAQQLWELFSGTSRRAEAQQHGRQELGPDEDFGAPMETLETYEDLMPDDDDDDGDDEYK